MKTYKTVYTYLSLPQVKETMPSFPLKKKRIETDLEFRVRLLENSPEKILDGEITATAINFSEGGACLIFPKVFFEKTHLFFSTLRSNTHTLILESGNSLQFEENFQIYAQSIWMNSCEYKNSRAFKVGVQFQNKQKLLFNFLKKQL